MFALLGVAFVALVIAEIYVMVVIAQAIGVLNMIGLLILCSLVGIWLAKHEGFGMLARIRDQAAARRAPTNEVVDGGLVLASGLLLIVPGFITDGVALVLLFPPTRAIARHFVTRRFSIFAFGTATRVDRNLPPDDVIDV
jgi:UPF0716 protein FxsA